MAEISIGSLWRCPFCSANSMISKDNLTRSVSLVNNASKHGHRAVAITSVSCANQDCRELSLYVDFGPYTSLRSASGFVSYKIEDWEVELSKSLLPDGVTVSVPSNVPEEIAITYKEAARIAEVSGRASAAMSRRCLQGMVRHFFDIPSNKRGNLGAELSFVKDRIDPDMWDNLQAVRGVGDIGAHMDNNVDQIIDISPEEARILLALIESLFKEWYEVREKRERSSSALKELLANKRTLKKEAKQKSVAVAEEDSDND